jgi:osmoprotectant transport system permease protein
MLAGLAILSVTSTGRGETVRVGSKNFTEQEILGELVAQLIERHTDLDVERKFGLGGTGLCHAALVEGQLDVYVEYTGTALLNVLNHPTVSDPDEALRIVREAYRKRFDLEWLEPIGFNSTYAITVRDSQAEREGWAKISDLSEAAPRLRAAFTSEFMERPDGYPGLKKVYGFAFKSAKDVDPGLMYEACANGQVDVICAFATDGRIDAYDLRVLKDDKGFFPPYDAAPVVRGALLRRHPAVRAALAPLAGAIDDATMRRMNYAVDELGYRPREIATRWLDAGEVPRTPKSGGFFAMLSRRRGVVARKTLEHLILTGAAMGIAIALGVPIGVLIHRFRRASAYVLAVTEIMQTIPSLAMLAFLFAVYRMLGTAPAITALVLYALLPIVLNTFTGLKEVSPQIVEAADGMGMSRRQRLWMVELPLALPVVVAGVRTATVWTVGIATLSTYIGAGGLGDLIARGLARNDAQLTLLGAVPAAVMAVVLSLGIRLVERWLRKV